MNYTKRMNSYIKFGIVILLCAAIGFVIGGLSPLLGYAVPSPAAGFLSVLANHIHWILAVFLLIEMICGEYSLLKIKKLNRQMTTADDDEHDALDYAMEKTSAIVNGILIALMALSFIMLTLICSAEYIEALPSEAGILTAVILFFLFIIYSGFWSVRFVKLHQKIDPEKQGDPASMRFTEQWVESCDEAEKELIYQSTYKCYVFLSKAMPFLIAAAMLTHITWDTGFAAVFYLCLVWLILNVTYLRNCLKGKRRKLRQ